MVTVDRFFWVARGPYAMTLISDPNRLLWEAVARGEPADWAGLATEPDGIEEELVEDPAGLWLRPVGAVGGPVGLAVHGGGFVSARPRRIGECSGTWPALRA